MKKSKTRPTQHKTDIFSDQRIHSQEPFQNDMPLSPQSHKFVRLSPLKEEKENRQPQIKVTKKQRAERINLLSKIKSIVSDYEQHRNQITEPICESVHEVLKILSTQESCYGNEMKVLFEILEKMIFCSSCEVIGSLRNYESMQEKPYGILINDVLERKMVQIREKEREIEQKVNEINSRIAMIEQQNDDKLRVLKIQYDNNVIAVSVSLKKEINFLRSKIDDMREALQVRDCRLSILESKNMQNLNDVG